MEDERMSEIHINDFPNEVLGMIFDQLPFVNLLRASCVCARWCAVVTSFCNDRILLRIRTHLDVESMQRFRNQKHVKIDCDSRARYGPNYSAEWMEWLKVASPTLQTLNISIRVGSFSWLLELDFQNLLELQLDLINYNQIEDSRQINQFFSGLKRLKVAKISAPKMVISQIARCIYSSNSIEQLELSPSEYTRVQTADIWHMTKLVELAILNFGLIECPPEHAIRPLSSLKKLKLRELQPRDISKLQIMFHNVTSLDIVRPISGDCLHQIVISWPTLEHLSVRVERLYGVAMDLRQLPDLRWLKLELVGVRRFSLRSSSRLLSSLLRIRSLERLYIVGYGDISIPGRNPRCRLFLNERLMFR